MKGYREFDCDVDTSVNLGEYENLATIHCDTFDEAFQLSNNIEGSWSFGANFEHPYSMATTSTQLEIVEKGLMISNDDYDSRIVMNPDAQYNTYEDHFIGFRSTSSGDVIYDHAKDEYIFLIPSYLEGIKHGYTTLNDFDPKEFVYQIEKVA